MSPFYEQPREDRVPEVVTQQLEHYTTDHHEWWMEWEQGAHQLAAFQRFEDVPEPIGDVTITIEVDGGMANVGQTVNALRLNMWRFGELATNLFAATGTDCPGTDNPDTEVVTVSAEQWKDFLAAHGNPDFPSLVILNVYGQFGENIDPAFCETVNQPNDFFKVRLNFEFDYAIEDTEPLELKLWNEDLCHNAAFTLAYEDGSPYPRIETEHAIRAVAQPASAIAEVCKPHAGEVVIDDDGFARGFYCSKPVPFGVTHDQQNHYADLFIVQKGDSDLRALFPKGYGVFIGAYAAPKWTEAQLWSHVETCEGII